MKLSSQLLFALLVTIGLALPLLSRANPASEIGSGRQLKLLAPSSYLPGIPVLIRIEITDASGRRDWSIWDTEATLASDSPDVTLSTNRVVLHHGMGSALVACEGDSAFQLMVAVGELQTSRSLQSLSPLPVSGVGGVLSGASSTWSGLIRITNDVLVPAGHTLTIASNTLVLMDGITNGTLANDIMVSGAMRSLGTEDHPVTITCANPDPRYRWGQIRHIFAQPSLYRFTSITRGGRGNGLGHTDTTPVVQVTSSKILLESCNLTDHAETSPASPEFGKPGKVLQASLGSEITFDNCLLARSSMGPEVSETALLFTNSCIMEMRGPNDSDGLFLDSQRPGQIITLTHSVIAGGDDDGIDTFAATFSVENCIIRNWSNPLEDSKGISVEDGEVHIRHTLLAENPVGLSVKGSDDTLVRVHIDHATILADVYAVGVTNKFGTSPMIDFRITNSIVRGTTDSIFTQYDPRDIRIEYSNIGESWFGTGNISSDPEFVNEAGHDYALGIDSPCIDAGDPEAALDADGSRTDMGYIPFIPPPPVLARSQWLPDGLFQFQLNAFPHRDYVVEVSTNFQTWMRLTTVTQTNDAVPVFDATTANVSRRFYRAHLRLDRPD